METRTILNWTFGAVLTVLVCAAALLPGCGGGVVDPNTTDPNTVDPNTTDPNTTDPNAVDPNATDPNAVDPNATADAHTILLPEEDRQAVTPLVEQFVASLATKSRDEARTDLINALAATEGVAEAKLFEDGYTVYIKMDDGYFAALNTVDFDALEDGVDEIDYENPDVFPEAEPAPRQAKVMTDPADLVEKLATEAHAPTSRKALLLNPSYPDMRGSADAVTAAVNTLKLRGWDDDDIVVKTRTTATSTEITPDDFLDLADYGIVVIFAQGLYGSPSGDSSLYVQCCSAVDYNGVAADDRIEQWNEWIEEGSLLVAGSASSGDVAFYMRADLFAAMDSLPDSFVYLVCPYGRQLESTFENCGCGTFFGWDDLPVSSVSYRSFAALFNNMAGGGIATCDYEAFSSLSSSLTECTNPEGGTATLHIIMADSQLYLPAWGLVTVRGASLPAGTVSKGVGVNYLLPVATGTKRPSVTMASENTADLEPLVPIEARIEGSAADPNGNVLATVNMNQTFTVGQNLLDVDFSRQRAQGEAYRIDRIIDGRTWTWLYVVYKFKQNPSSNRYKIFTEYYPDGYAIRQPLIYDGLHWTGDYCYNREQVESIFGDDPFDVPEGYVVWGGASEYSNYDPNDEYEMGTTWAERVDEAWAQTLERAPESWVEVAFD